MDKKESLEKTKELSKVDPVAEMEYEEEKQEVVEKVKKEEKEKEYDQIKHNRLMMEFDAHDIDEDSPKSVNERKKITILLAITLLGIIVVCILLFIYTNLSSKPVFDYKEFTTSSLSEIYSNNNASELKELIGAIKEDKKKINYLKEQITDSTNEWIDYLITKKFADIEDFNNGCESIKKKIKLIYETEVNDAKLISEEEYNKLLGKINEIATDGTEYYNAYGKYISKEYNEAYSLFANIKKENKFYKEAQSNLERIVNEVIDEIQKEIDEVSIIDPDDRNIVLNKLNQYMNTYSNLDLKNNTKYQNMIKAYKE